LYQLGEELFLGEPAQAARRGQQRHPPVKPRVGAVLPGFFINTLLFFLHFYYFNYDVYYFI
jgi:hypothetical protein